jgi:hypothetical protein
MRHVLGMVKVVLDAGSSPIHRRLLVDFYAGNGTRFRAQNSVDLENFNGWKTCACDRERCCSGARQRARQDRNAPLSIGAGDWLDRSCGGTSGADSNRETGSVLYDQIFKGQSVWVFVLLPGLIGFAAAIFLLQCLVWLEDWLPELPWRRQRFPREDPSPNIIDRGKIWVQKIPVLVVRLRRVANQRIGVRPAIFTMTPAEKQGFEKPKHTALSIFGVRSGSSNSRNFAVSPGKSNRP